MSVNGITAPWLGARDDVLRRMWDEGQSCAQIAAALDTTRNAITGRAHRLKLPKHVNANIKGRGKIGLVDSVNPLEIKGFSASARRKDGSSSTMESAGEKRQRQRPLAISASKPKMLRLDQLGMCQCHYPYGDGPFLFCGVDIPFGESYCPQHKQACLSNPKRAA